MRRTYATAMAVFLLLLAMCGCGGNAPVASHQAATELNSAADPTRDPPPNFGMHRLAGSGNLGANSCIIVHGLFDTYPEMATLAQRLYYQFNYRNVYAMGYNWRISTVPAAQYLAGQLDNLRSVGKQVTLVGHSRGCLIIRYALEKLEKTHCVKQCFLIAGPHRGSSYATSAHQLLILLSQVINQEYGSNIDLSANYPAIQELVPGNPFLTELNSPNYNQRPMVDYYLFAGGRDYIVPRSSARAESVTLEGVTSGAVNRFTVMEATHGDFRRNNAHFQTMVNQIRSAATARARIEIDPPQQWTYGWTLPYLITNPTNQAMLIKTMTFDTYDKFGNWQTCSWYRQGPDNFPNQHYDCNFTLRAHSEAYLLVYNPGDLANGATPINQLPEYLQARTTIIAMVYEQNGVRQDIRATALERFNGAPPAVPAKTRDGAYATPEGQLSGLKLAQPIEIRPITN